MQEEQGRQTIKGREKRERTEGRRGEARERRKALAGQ
jgi:hypothetical protein